MATLDETPLVTLFNRNEEKVFAPVEFSPRFSQRSDNPNGVTVSGTVLAGNSTAIDVSSEIDLDAFDDVDRIEQLYSAGLLSDAARIDTYLDLIESGSLTLDCIPYVMNVCNQYYETQNLSQVAVENINTVYSAQSAELDAALAALTDSNESDHFKLYYDSTDVSSSVATKILNFLEDMYDISVSLGFRTPVLESGFSKTRVYIDTGANPEGSGRGYTYAVETNGNHAASYITIWNFRTSNSVWSQWKETIAHEYFHAVQYAYYYHENWFREASAVWFAAKYSGSITRAKDHFDSYFENIRKSISNYPYGAGVLPMAIDVAYGGDTTIRRIYERMDSNGASTETALRNCITWAIQKNDSSGSFAEAYKKIGAYVTPMSLS